MLLRSLLDFLFPRFCEVCGTRLEIEEKVICCACNDSLPRTLWWKNNDYTNKPYKPNDNIFKEITDRSLILGSNTKAPKDKAQLFEENLLAQKYWGRANVVNAMSYMKYEPKSNIAKLVYAFKYQQKDYVAVFLGEQIGKELGMAGFFEGIDFIVPVPLTRKREQKRGYNQCVEIARGISKVTGIKTEERILKRVRFNKSQTKVSGLSRQSNIEGAFALDKKASNAQNSHILLLDDIITTGATTIECCKVLQKIQGVRISVLSLGIVTI